MADEKKPVESNRIAVFEPHPDPFVEAVWWIFTFLVAAFILNGFISLFTSARFTSIRIIDWIKHFFLILVSWVEFLKLLSIAFTLVIIALLIYTYIKLRAIREIDRKLFYPETDGASVTDKNLQWELILAHIESLNENDWRTAVLEADIILGDLLDTLFLPGETIGDKLKAVEKSDFTTVDNAWEAHKVRNQIAHEGSAFQLSQREAKRVIHLYQEVFEEFKII